MCVCVCVCGVCGVCVCVVWCVVCVSVGVCAHACVRACVCMCVRVCVCMCVRAPLYTALTVRSHSQSWSFLLDTMPRYPKSGGKPTEDEQWRNKYT